MANVVFIGDGSDDVVHDNKRNGEEDDVCQDEDDDKHAAPLQPDYLANAAVNCLGRVRSEA